jgi:toxin ParE1/3/4
MASERNMVFRVELTTRAKRDLEEIAAYVEVEFFAAAATWFDGLYATLRSLERLPKRAMVLLMKPTVHQILYGNKPHVYRILFRVRAAQKVVRVLHVRHSRRDGLGLGRED